MDPQITKVVLMVCILLLSAAYSSLETFSKGGDLQGRQMMPYLLDKMLSIIMLITHSWLEYRTCDRTLLQWTEDRSSKVNNYRCSKSEKNTEKGWINTAYQAVTMEREATLLFQINDFFLSIFFIYETEVVGLCNQSVLDKYCTMLYDLQVKILHILCSSHRQLFCKRNELTSTETNAQEFLFNDEIDNKIRREFLEVILYKQAHFPHSMKK